MNICGLQKTTLLDYPGHLAATIFFGGCNFRCPFCHNSELVLQPDKGEHHSPEEILSFLDKRKNTLQGVCITGGEPTLEKELPNFLESIKDLDYLIKLDTNGSHPAMLKDLYQRHLIDYVAMDIKSGPSDYLSVCGLEGSHQDLLSQIKESIHFLIRETDASRFQYEFRTTCVYPLHSADSFREIADLIQGASQYYIQSFVDNGSILSKASLDAFSREELLDFAKIVSPFVQKVSLRGIESH